MGIVKSNTTIVHVTFYTWRYGRIDLDGGVVGLPVDQAEAAGVGANTPIVAYSFDKRLGMASGQFSLTLKGRAEGCSFPPTPGAQAVGRNGMPWTELLDEGDWWQMSVDRNGQELAVSYGKVDSVGVEIQADRGVGVVTVTVSGRDIGFALDDTPVYFNPFDPAASNELGINMLKIINGQGGSPAEVVTNMITGMMGVRTGGLLGSHVGFPPGLAVKGVRDYWVQALDTVRKVSPLLRGRVLIPQAVMNAERSDNSVWQYVDTWRNPTMNELFLDVDPKVTARIVPGSKPWPIYLVLREKPFVNATQALSSPWYQLTTAVVEASSVSGVSLSKGPHRVNHVMLMGSNIGVLGQDEFGLHPPVADMQEIDHHGLHRLVERTNYIESGTILAVTELKQWRSLVVSWNALNHKYFTGHLSIPEARVDIRVGQKIAIVNGPLGGYEAFPTSSNLLTEIPLDALTFYVEGVRYSGSFGPQPTHRTEVMVSRGYVEGDRVTDLLVRWSRFQEFTPGGMLPHSPQPPPGNVNEDAVDPKEGPVHETESET